MAVLEASLSIFSFSSSSSSSKPYLFSKRSSSLKLTALSLRIPSNLSPVFSLRSGSDNSRRLVSVLCSVAEKETSADEETSQEEKTEETQNSNLKRKLFVFNLPWSMSVNDISELFGQCGTVNNVEVFLLSQFRFNLYVITSNCLTSIYKLFLDYKAKRWKEPRICFCNYGFWRRSSSSY